MVVRMTASRVLIITDEAKTFEEAPKSNTIFDIYSGSFNAVKSFYKKLKEIGLRVDLKILLNSNFIVDAFDEIKSHSHSSISEFISDVNSYDAVIVLLSKNRLLYFISEYRKNNINFRGDIFIVGPASVKSEIDKVFSLKATKMHFFKRVGVARLNKNYSNNIIQTLVKLKEGGHENG